MVGIPSPKIVKNLPWTYTVNKNHIGSAVKEILHYRQKKLTTLYNRINFILIMMATYFKYETVKY